MHQTSAILLHRSRLTETSLIVHWCSAEAGLFRTVAKGALRPRSPFAGRLDLFATCEIVYVRSARSELHLLREVHLADPRLGLRANYPRVLAAAYFSRLVEMVAEREAPLGTLHRLLVLALDHLNTRNPTAALVTRFEDRLCEELGLGAPKQGGAAILHQYFHRPLPPQREELFLHFATPGGRRPPS